METESERDTRAYSIVGVAVVVVLGMAAVFIIAAHGWWLQAAIIMSVIVIVSGFFVWRQSQPREQEEPYLQRLGRDATLTHKPSEEAQEIEGSTQAELVVEDSTPALEDDDTSIEGEPLKVVRRAPVVFAHAAISFGVTLLTTVYVLIDGKQDEQRYQVMSIALVLVVAAAPVVVRLMFRTKVSKESLEMRKRLMKNKLFRVLGFAVIGVVIIGLVAGLLDIAFDFGGLLAIFQAIWDAFVWLVTFMLSSWLSVMVTLLLMMGSWLVWLAWGHFLNHTDLYGDKLTRVSGVGQNMATVYFARVVGRSFAPAFALSFFRWQFKAPWGDLIIETQGSEENLNMGSHIGEERFVLRGLSTKDVKLIAQLIDEGKPGR